MNESEVRASLQRSCIWLWALVCPLADMPDLFMMQPIRSLIAQGSPAVGASASLRMLCTCPALIATVVCVAVLRFSKQGRWLLQPLQAGGMLRAHLPWPYPCAMCDAG